jgi:DNA-binding NarL/FixJ family response regulator
VRLVCEGLGNAQIAKRLRISEVTVKTHVHRIYEKLRLRDRLQLSLYGRERGLH